MPSLQHLLGFSHSHQFSPLRPWRNRHKPHRLPPRSFLKYAYFIHSLLRSPNRGPLFFASTAPGRHLKAPMPPWSCWSQANTKRASERRRRKPELPPTLLSVVRPRPCAARPMPPLSSRRCFVYSGAIQCPKARDRKSVV